MTTPLKPRRIRVVGAMIQSEGGRYLITQRRPEATLPLLWEFPGGRVEEHETEEEALARELKAEMDIDVAVEDEVMHTHHVYEKYEIDFHVFRCRLTCPESKLKHIKVHDHRWVTLPELSNYEFPPADARTIEKLLGLS
jgi:8-oxo-dGTP diphosphatase